MTGSSFPLSAFNVRDVIALARKAGAVIMAMRPAVIANPDIKSDGSPVTLADKKASEIVIAGLALLTPDIPVISEENAEEDNLAILHGNSTYWIVDPLDGTRTYIDGHDGFGVHIGLISQGEPVAGIVYFPAMGVVYFTDGDASYSQRDGMPAQKLSVTPLAGLKHPFTVATAWGQHRQPKNGVTAIAAVGGARLCVTAAALTDVALLEAKFSYWDVAAAHAVLRGAGGELFDLQTGQPLRYSAHRLFIDPAVGGHPAVIARVREHLRDEVGHMQLQPRKFTKKTNV